MNILTCVCACAWFLAEMQVIWRNKKETREVRRVRLLHLSRPLVGGLAAAPENDGELSMEVVNKYIAVLRSYPGVYAVFSSRA